ncbi:hypothetical protein PHK61_16775 [Actinomycetospora lutea]|nr:hypothetical protein [Actinomycetospora lutea]MDD7940077.1 hypothetical protein [Actinomycetospora lutea]
MTAQRRAEGLGRLRRHERTDVTRMPERAALVAALVTDPDRDSRTGA